MTRFGIAVCVLTLAGIALADDAKKYALKIDPATAKVGQASKAKFEIDVVPGSHVSDEAPLKIALKSDGLKLGKDKLVTADIVDGKGASPKFEVPFTADQAGARTIEADAVFIVCTKELCERETEHLTIPVTVKE